MVFSSVPLYIDPPSWHQYPNDALQNPVPAQPLPDQPGGAVVTGTLPPSMIRSNSTAERARVAKIPLPEGQLKCPRCESTNTKFCYYNNYSLSQPRHFCKTCRRYWTRGGALRNVPVGGTCRRNNRRKTLIRSKSKLATTGAVDSVGDFGPPALPFGSLVSSFQNVTQLQVQGMGSYGDGSCPGGVIQAQAQAQLQQVQVPFMLAGFGGGLPSSSMYHFQNDGAETATFREGFGGFTVAGCKDGGVVASRT